MSSHPIKVAASSPKLSRREMLQRAVFVGVAIVAPRAIALPVEPGAITAREAEFTPENDYPFFGYEPSTPSEN